MIDFPERCLESKTGDKDRYHSRPPGSSPYVSSFGSRNMSDFAGVRHDKTVTFHRHSCKSRRALCKKTDRPQKIAEPFACRICTALTASMLATNRARAWKVSVPRCR